MGASIKLAPLIPQHELVGCMYQIGEQGGCVARNAAVAERPAKAGRESDFA